MRSISGQLTKELIDSIGDKSVASADAYIVHNYRELMHIVAHLSFLNKDYLLFYRGQGRDFRNKVNDSTIYPTIYRGEQLSQKELNLKFGILDRASEQLCSLLEDNKIEGCKEVAHYKYVQWSILQHYEVCSTPLLDLTHSLRVACSFAFLASNTGDPYVFVFGLPYVTNRISTNSEQEMVNVRLLSISPPDALRPYFQEGYLAGTEEITTNFTSKNELDFKNRLIAKFRLKRDQFWGEGFESIPKSALYPDNDQFEGLCTQLLNDLNDPAKSLVLGKFLQESHDLEGVVMAEARLRQSKVYSLSDASTLLQQHAVIDDKSRNQFDNIRLFRKRVVFQPANIKAHEIVDGLKKVRSINLNLR